MTGPVHPMQTEEGDRPVGARTIAAAWFARQRSGEMTEQEARDLAVWLEADPKHRAALELAERVWTAVEGVRANPTMLVIRERALRRRSWRSWPVVSGALAASLMVAVLGGWLIRDAPQIGAPTPVMLSKTAPQEFRTGVGQRASVTLPDGSVVTLGTDTVLRASHTPRQRLMELEKGQAFFRVAKDRSRPFLVRAAGRTVVATGTAFEVRIDQGRVAVTLVEGKVRVEAPINGRGDGRFSPFVQTTEMSPGSQLVAQDGRPWAVAQVDAEKEVSWLVDKLVFQNEPLAQVVAELNRYSDKHIVLRDPAIAELPVSGSFKTDDIDESVRAIVGYGLARVARENEDVVELTGSAQVTEKKVLDAG